jgi:hypothetical protein
MGAFSEKNSNQSIFIETAKKYVASLNRTYPTTVEEFEDYKINYPDDYYHLCVPALSASLYEPKTTQPLNDKFKQGNWEFIPLILLMRGYYLKITNHNDVGAILDIPVPSVSSTFWGVEGNGREMFYGIQVPYVYVELARIQSYVSGQSFKFVCKF